MKSAIGYLKRWRNINDSIGGIENRNGEESEMASS